MTSEREFSNHYFFFVFFAAFLVVFDLAFFLSLPCALLPFAMIQFLSLSRSSNMLDESTTRHSVRFFDARFHSNLHFCTIFFRDEFNAPATRARQKSILMETFFLEKQNMAGRQSKLRIQSLNELKKTLSDNPGVEFALLVRGERKVEMDIDQKVVDELQRMLQKAVGNRGDDY